MNPVTEERAKFSINKKELVALLSHASKEENRPFSALAFDTEKARAMATDGHRLALCQCQPTTIPITSGKVYLLPLSAAEDISKRLKPNEEADISFDDTTKEAIVASPMGVSKYKLRDDNYPPVDQVIPKYDDETKSCTKIGFNPFYLADLELIGKAVSIP